MTTNTSAELTTNAADSAATFDLPPLSALSDSDLLTSTRRLVGRSNQLLAALLLHLGEVETRGLHRARACASLYTYCIFELRFSEDEAFRRVAAARLVQRFPALFDAIAKGELHLTGLLMLGPHLTLENVGQVLARARHRTKKEIARLVRELAPLPDVPARIEPLGPAPARLVPSSPSWEQWAVSLCPVRELTPGDRPGDWVDDANDAAAEAPDVPAVASGLSTGLSEPPEAPQQSSAPAPVEAPIATQRYRIEFTASEEYVRLVERAEALLSHALPSGALEEIHLRAMRLLVSELERRKYAVRARPRKRSPEASATPPSAPFMDSAASPLFGDSAASPAALDSEGLAGPSSGTPQRREPEAGAPRQRGRSPGASVTSPSPLFEDSAASPAAPNSEALARPSSGTPQRRELEAGAPRQRGRHVPAAVRRAVFERDGGRCSYLDARGERCHETHRLEFHHLEAFARGGEHSEANLTLRCAPHNALAAEGDFGRDFMVDKREALEHESAASVARGLLTANRPP